MQKRTIKITAAVAAVVAVAGLAASASAFKGHWGGRMMMRHMDANADGKITREELTEGYKKLYMGKYDDEHIKREVE